MKLHSTVSTILPRECTEFCSEWEMSPSPNSISITWKSARKGEHRAQPRAAESSLHFTRSHVLHAHTECEKLHSKGMPDSLELGRGALKKI